MGNGSRAVPSICRLAALTIALALFPTIGEPAPVRAHAPSASPSADTAAAQVRRDATGERPHNKRLGDKRPDPDRPNGSRDLDRITRIVSTSGIPHADVADLRASPAWRKGMPIGTNDAWDTAIDSVIEQIAATRPDGVLHTGDMVEGRWGFDVDGRGVFGPVNTFSQRQVAAKRAAQVYYPYILEKWKRHGLRPHFAVGDHEIGDIGGSGMLQATDFRTQTISMRRYQWARYFTDAGTRYDLHPKGTHRRTAYATRIGDVGVVTIEPFERWADGSVHVRVGSTQRAWMEQVVPQLRADGARWIVVQCEVPALGPNRRNGTSGLQLQNADVFWQLLVDLKVDLLLSAEFHTMTTHSTNDTTPVQIVHGGSLVRKSANWLVIDTFDDRMELELVSIRGKRKTRNKIWAPTAHRAPRTVELGKAVPAGRMTVYDDGTLSNRRGFLTDGID